MEIRVLELQVEELNQRLLAAVRGKERVSLRVQVGYNPAVLVSSGCGDKTPQAGWLVNRNVFLAVLEAEKCQQICCLFRFSFWFTEVHLSASSQSRRGRRVLLGLF